MYALYISYNFGDGQTVSGWLLVMPYRYAHICVYCVHNKCIIINSAIVMYAYRYARFVYQMHTLHSTICSVKFCSTDILILPSVLCII